MFTKKPGLVAIKIFLRLLLHPHSGLLTQKTIRKQF